MIIELSTDDAEVVSQIHRECFDYGWSEKSFREMLSSDVFFGFSSEENFVEGFVLCKIVCEEIEIVTFCVLPKFRNRGVGKSLIRSVDDYAKNHSVEKIFLEVSEDNVIAQKIYENFGYKKISERRRYYLTPTSRKNAIIMMKTF
ncbi:MAG: ribosomal protein S18-alanine N-acetyltransferase [Holosporaceae bacterium]|jgi:ribosomal-protein-alanine N-acetyltransferase|nr:ribosomal protein S18-alanine N-acetyltransferase [Holosporaceae bacterium]